MPLTNKQKKYLKGLAHHLKAVVQIGNPGVSHAVVRQLEQALEQHELIKVQVPAGSSESRKEVAKEAAGESSSELVQLIGRIAVLYKARAEEPEIKLPRG